MAGQALERGQDFLDPGLCLRYHSRRPFRPRRGHCCDGIVGEPPDPQDDFAHHCFTDLLVYHRHQLVAQHMQLVQPNRILNAEVQSPIAEVLHPRSLSDPWRNDLIPCPQKGEVTDHTAETQSLKGSPEHIRAPGWVSLLTHGRRSLPRQRANSTFGATLADSATWK